MLNFVLNMTEGNKFTYNNFAYSINADKILDIHEDDIDILLKKYNISKTSLEEMIANIRHWYQKQPHVPHGQLHDRMILGHLITRGFSVEQSKERIDNYFAARHKMPEILCDRDPTSPRIDTYLKHGYWVVAPKTTTENYRVSIFRIMHPEDLTVTEAIKVGFMLMDYRLMNDICLGDHFVFDYSNVMIQHVLQVTPFVFSNIYYYVTQCYAPKIKGMHLVGLPAFAKPAIMLLMKILKKKHIERMYMYEKFEDVYNVLPREIFPKDIGGTADITCEEVAARCRESIQSETWVKFFEHQNKHFFTDESKRLESSKNREDFGLEGTFRKLELD